LTAGDLVLRHVKRANDALAQHWPRQAEDLAGFREVFGPALAHVLPIAWPDTVRAEALSSVEGDHQFRLERLLLGRPGQGDQVPALLFHPPGWAGGSAVLAVHAAGKAALIDAPRRRPGALIRELLARGRAVLAVDVFLTGEYHTPAGWAGRDQSIPFFTTYNRTDSAWRVQDVVTALAYLSTRAAGSEVALVGIADAGLWCLLARALAPMLVPSAIDAAGFSGDDASYVERLYVPGLRAAGGLVTALALAAPAPTFIHNTGGAFPLQDVARLYGTLGYPGALVDQDGEATTGAVVAWLSRTPG
jgi:hypothetical protein